MRAFAFLFALLAGFAFLCAYAWRWYVSAAPDEWDVTAPLDLALPPTFVTDWKLAMADTDACFAALDRAGVRFMRLPDRETGENCRIEDAATLDRALVSWGGGVTLQCKTLVDLILWERHVAAPAAQEIFGEPLTRIRHFGTYACRNVNNRARGRRSEHAFANAIDIAGFDLESGARIEVERHWGAPGREGAFLKRVHAGACARFASVLGPDYNALHANHFHFDNGVFGICR